MTFSRYSTYPGPERMAFIYKTMDTVKKEIRRLIDVDDFYIIVSYGTACIKRV